MALSYSFHISNDKNAINTSKQLSKRLQHNLRSYSQQKLKEKSYNREKNFVLLGPNNATKAFEKFKKFYSETFDAAVKEYNSTKKKTRDKIENYFNHISNSKKSEIATEIIIQVGDTEFWKTKSYDEQKQMNKIFQSQIKKLKNELPNFKILSAVAHYDESSPHIQLIGVPIAYYKKGLKVRTTKGKVFSRESLETLQNKMREDVLEQMQELYGKDIDLKAKEKGRNHDLLIKDYIKLKQEQEKQLKSELEPIQKQMQDNINQLSNQKDEIQKEIQEKEAIKNKYKEDKIWYSAKAINKIDTEKQIKRKGSIPFTEDYNKEIVVLDKENYEIMLTMAKDQSTQLTAWKQSSNGFENENKKLKDDLKSKDKEIEELETTISNQKDEIEELDTKISFIDYAIKMFLKEQTYNKIKEIAEEIKNYWDLKKVKQKIDNFAFPFTKNKNKYKDYDDFEK